MQITMLKENTMYEALFHKDSRYEGQFVAAVKTTGIFCRPTCTARKPKPENVEYYKTPHEAIAHGYRPCKVCRPLEPLGGAPGYINKILAALEENPHEKITTYRLRQMGIDPNKVRRWFKTNHGITFAGYQRMLRLNTAFNQLKNGDKATDAAFDNGYNSLSGFGTAFKNLIGEVPKNAKYVNIITTYRITTPLGPMLAGAIDDKLCMLEFTDRRMLETELKDLSRLLKANIVYGTHPLIEETEKQLNEYFNGERTEFTIPLKAPGTDFQKKVWEALLTIPHGETRSYEAQANILGKPEAIRAVARANGMNRISIIIPCHRVIGKDGSLTGYGGGLPRKKWLLEHEGAKKQGELF